MAGAATILIAGPTGAGKSALALALAGTRGGTVINADSMQVYRDLRVLTARPTPAEEALTPHALFGHVDGSQAYSVGRWVEDARKAIAVAHAAGRTAIIVGGTGLYFKALTEGLAPIPPVPPPIRAHWRGEVQRIGAARAHALLAERDAAMAARLAPGDAQRIVRALEVLDATGRSLAAWQGEQRRPVVDAAKAEKLVVTAPRAVIQARCDARFVAMVEGGALPEVEALIARGLAWNMPVLRALGVRPLARHLVGEIGRAEAIRSGQMETRRYVKRQETWLRRNMTSWERHETQ